MAIRRIRNRVVREVFASAMRLFRDTLLDSPNPAVLREWAARLASGPTLALGAIKLGMRRALHSTYRDALHWEATMLSLVAQTEDAAEGLRAFFEKRKPQFKGS